MRVVAEVVALVLTFIGDRSDEVVVAEVACLLASSSIENIVGDAADAGGLVTAGVAGARAGHTFTVSHGVR